MALFEIERRQDHIEKLEGTSEDLVNLVKQCLNNDPHDRPIISDVSENIKRIMKGVASAKGRSIKASRVIVSWLIEQPTNVLKGATVTVSPSDSVSENIAFVMLILCMCFLFVCGDDYHTAGYCFKIHFFYKICELKLRPHKLLIFTSSRIFCTTSG